jgi:hypothetical protein
MTDAKKTFEPPTVTDMNLRDLPRGRWDAVEVPTGASQWYRMATGYKEAADRLVAASDAAYRRHTLGGPILFLYRHYVELHLKSLLLDAGELLDDPQNVPPKHYLRTLWDRVRALLLKISPGSDEQGPWFSRADDIIAELDALDATSFAFRYPVDKDGNPSLQEPAFFDPAVVAAVIAELHILLDGASTQIDVYQGYKYEGL